MRKKLMQLKKGITRDKLKKIKIENEIECFTITIKYEKVIPVDDFKKHLEGLNNQFARFCNNDSRLGIKEINKCCIEIVLLAIQNPMLLVNTAYTIQQFSKNIISTFKNLKNQKYNNNFKDKKEVENFEKMATPLANPSVCFIFNGDVNNSFINNSDFANISKNIAESKEKFLNKNEETIDEKKLENVRLRLKQIRTDDTDTRTKQNTGIIKKFSGKELRLVFGKGIKDKIFKYPNLNNIDFVVNAVHNVVDDYYLIEDFWDEIIESDNLF